MSTDLADIQALASKFAMQAGALLLKGQHTALASVAATKSSVNDIVTQVDRDSEEFIVSAIQSTCPDDAILGEEGASVEGTSGVRWVIDPLDGTVNFTYGLPNFAVSIGVEVDGIASVGAVYNPATDQLFTAIRGSGAQLNGSPIAVRTPVAIEQALIATGFSYERAKRILQLQILERVLPEVRDIRRMGSAALDMCSAAIGTVDAYYERGGHPWDFCAGEVIAREAGLTVTGFDNGPVIHDAVAAPPSLHARLLKLIDG